MPKTIGVIGLGSIGSRHAKNLEKLGHRVLRYDPPEGENDEIFGHCDAYIIASPTDTHYEYITSIISQNPTAKLFVEKPIASNGPDTGDLLYVTMVGYNLRFNSCVIKAKEWIDHDAALGDHPIWANLVCAQLNSKYRDHVILNWSHEIDLALYLLGPAKVRACSGDEHLSDIILSHENGCQSTIHLDYLTNPEIRQTVIVGDEATIIIDIVHRHAWLRSNNGSILDHYEGTDSFDSNYIDEIESFIARIDGQETVGCTGREGCEVLKICLEAQKLAAQ